MDFIRLFPLFPKGPISAIKMPLTASAQQEMEAFVKRNQVKIGMAAVMLHQDIPCPGVVKCCNVLRPKEKPDHTAGNELAEEPAFRSLILRKG